MSIIKNAIIEAMRLLTKKGSRAKMIIAGILMMFAFAFSWLVGRYTVNILELTGLWRMLAEYLIIAVVGIIVSLPALSMFITYSKEAYSMAKYGYADIKKKGAYNYFRSLFSAIILFLRPFVALVIIQGTYELALLCTEKLKIGEMGIPFLVFLIPFWCIAFVVIAIFMFITKFVFFTPFYYSKGMSVFKALGKSFKTTVKHPFYSDLFSIVFIFLTAVSFLTFGVLFILFVLPLMMFTYFEIADKADSE